MKGSSALVPGNAEAAESVKHASVIAMALPPLEPSTLVRNATVPAALTRIVIALPRVPLCDALTQTVRVVGVHVEGYA